MDTPEAPDLTRHIVRLGSGSIATGGYSSVWRGSLYFPTSNDPNQRVQVAIKVLRASFTDEHTAKRKLHKRLHTEMRIWARLDHENVVALLGHTQDPEGPGLVSMWYPHGSILSFLAKNPSVNREVLCADVAMGLQYLHEHKPCIIHGDLKGANVLIDSEGKASICDFGLSIILDGAPTGHTSSNFGGSLRFLAPELLEESIRTVETDIYGYACACIEILFDREPYHQLSKEGHLVRAIVDHRPPFEPSNEDVTFPLFLDILRRSWHYDRSIRPSLSVIINTIRNCLYCTYQANLTVHQGIGRHLRVMCLPGTEQGNLTSVADGGLSIIVDCSTSFRRVPIYQRYRWEWMDTNSLKYSKDSNAPWYREPESRQSLLAAFSSLLADNASSSGSPPSISEWRDYSAKFRLPYSSMVSYEMHQSANSKTLVNKLHFLDPIADEQAAEPAAPDSAVITPLTKRSIVLGSMEPGYADLPPSVRQDFPEVRLEPVRPHLNVAPGQMCVAVDFGTVLSGVACGFSPNTVEQILWPGLNRKVHTCLVYDAMGRVAAWGYEARTIHLEEGWIRCETFKLYLDPFVDPNDLPQTLPPGKTLVDVISDYLRKLWENVKPRIIQRGYTQDILQSANVLISIPASWNRQNREIVREAAYMAGLVALQERYRLRIISDQEAAGAHCALWKDLRLTPSQSLMICDVGAARVDTAVYKILRGDPVQIGARYLSSGISCGSHFLDLRFRKYLEQWHETRNIRLSETNLTDYMHAFTYKWKLAFTGQQDAIALHFGSHAGLSDDEFVNNQLVVPGKVLRDQVFDPVVKDVLDLIAAQLQKVDSVDALFLVGGFSASRYLFDRIWSAFHVRLSDRIHTPEDSDIATSLGAVHLGLTPALIQRLTSIPSTNRWRVDIAQKPFISLP